MPSLVLCLYIGRAIRTIQSLSFILFSYLVYPSLITILYIHFYTVQSIVLFSKPNDDFSNLGKKSSSLEYHRRPPFIGDLHDHLIGAP